MIMTRDQALRYGLSFPDTYQDAPFHDDNWQLVRFKGNKKAFLWTYEKDGFMNLNVKADRERLFFWREAYPSVMPGYHQNKEHWNTIVLDGSIPDKDIIQMIAESYDLVSYSPSKKIYEAVKLIPYGRVATYAQVAELAGDRKMARAVGNALHKNPDPENIPCFRVVNSKGELAGAFAFGGANVQADLLAAEGVEVNEGRVDLGKYQWRPGVSAEAIERVRRMEETFDRAQKLMETYESDPSVFTELQYVISILEDYYRSPQWREDFEADERGEFPAGMKRGVLSEDGIYNLLEGCTACG